MQKRFRTTRAFGGRNQEPIEGSEWVTEPSRKENTSGGYQERAFMEAGRERQGVMTSTKSSLLSEIFEASKRIARCPPGINITIRVGLRRPAWAGLAD
jgi:hypothetical protein